MTGTSTHPSASGRTSKTSVRPGWVIASVLVLVTVLFITQNRDPVSIQLFVATVSAPLWLLLSITALVGAVVGALLRSRR
jgi:uncharacterized integral membrane protein